MSIAGGLLPSDQLPKQKLNGNYVEAGEGKFIVLQNGTRMAAEYKKGNEVPPGYAVINIDHGNNVSEVGPVPVTCGEDTLVIPRGSDRMVPIGHVNVLNDAVITEYYQRDLMSSLQSRSSRRFNFIVKKWPKTGDKAAADISMETLEDSIERHEVIDLNQD
jgi:hypothetical protein